MALAPEGWGLEMSSVVGMTAKQMGRAIIMPNLSPPIKTSVQALLYREEIIQALPNDTSFSPTDDVISDRQHNPERHN